MTEPTITVRRDRERMFEKRHPWVFSGAIHTVKSDPQDGDIVDLRTDTGTFLARGYWNHHSQIRIHILTWDEHETIDEQFWHNRLIRSINSRAVLNDIHDSGIPNAYRLINAENDALPGLVVDRYGDYLVLQALTLGIDNRKALIAELLMDILKPVGIYERSDIDVRTKEGLTESKGVLTGQPPPEYIEIDENGLRFFIDVVKGHKTGFYLDQRENRALLHKILTSNPRSMQRSVLNCFCYTGGFSVYAMAAGLQDVVSVDASNDALMLAERNMQLNGINTDSTELIEADVFDLLRHYRKENRKFDVIILDPPKFAQNQRQVDSACRGYKDINLLAFQLIKPGGLLMTYSCSGLVDTDLFQKVVFSALVDAKREGQILSRLSAGPDHPVSLTFPEGSYLKGLLCRVW
jgi:23S rRNA (cytosine1962-C5)-methyltransferase